MKDKRRNIEKQQLETEIKMPEYISLREKYKCDQCIFNSRNKINRYYYSFPRNLKYMFSTCKGEPCKRTQCKKRCWLFSDLFSLVTALILVIAFISISTHIQSLMLSLAYTIVFAVGLDILCCIIEYVVDKIFEGTEKLRRKNYDKKVENLEAINNEKIKEEERQKERKSELYKDINEAKKLFNNLSNEYLNRLKESNKSNKFIDIKKDIYKKYEELLKNIGDLLKCITLENFYLSEVKTLFQVYIPKLCDHITIYSQKAENENETQEQVEQLAKLLDSFNTKVIQIKENIDKADSESLVYKMQALREVISSKKYKQED